MNYKLRVALTNRRRGLLAEAQRKIENFEPINFAYASVNGDIKIRMVDNKVFLIKSSEDIDELLNSLEYVEAQIHMDAGGEY